MSLGIQLLFLIRQFCDEEKLQQTAHMLEQESGLFFDMKYFEELVMSGHWNEAEKYLSGFTRLDGNQHALKMYFEIRKQKFFEALDKRDLAMALDILMNDLKVFAPLNEVVYKEMTSLLTMDDFRKHQSLSTYGDVISARRRLMDAIKLLIEANPDFHRKLEFPGMENSRLRRLINQSLNWQHNQCTYRKSVPQLNTLFFDHKCSGQSKEQIPLPFQAMSASIFPSVANSIVPPSTVLKSQISASAFNIGNQNNLAMALEGSTASRVSPRMTLDKMVSNASIPIESQNSINFPEDLPKTVERCMDMNFSPTSMDFHPDKETLLLVGNITGDIELWDTSSEVKLFSNAFMIWQREAISMTFLNDHDRYPQMSVRRVLWSPCGSLFGVAYSKQIVQLYSYDAMSNSIEKQLEVYLLSSLLQKLKVNFASDSDLPGQIEAHVGSVNDLAFSSPDDQSFLITCGEDKLIQVWDTVTGSKQYTFEGHGTPVYSLCTHLKKDIHYVFSTSTNGEIKAWLFEDTGPRIVFDAPGHSCVRMAYSADGQRLFSCGTNEDGDSYIVEWNDAEGYITRSYHGLCKSSAGIVQFSTSKNRFLVAGDEHLIKVWDMDNVKLLTTVDADGSLPARTYVCFNKQGTLLAVLANDSKIKILANNVGSQLLRTSTLCSVHSTGYPSEFLQPLSYRPTPTPARVRVEDEDIPREESMKRIKLLEMNKHPNTRKYPKIVQVSRCQSLRLRSELNRNKICRLVYTNAGNGILALAADGIHLLWKWSGHEYMSYGKATTSQVPHLWQPTNGLIMMNDLTDDPFQLVSSCFALSKNDSYLVSASGKTVSLFNTMSFEKMGSFLLPPPAATCMAFYPSDNNIVAIGMDDSTILIYNLKESELINTLSGHLKRISGLAFSNTLKVLISSAVDTQIILWDSVKWEKKKSIALQIISVGWLPLETSETTVQFHGDQRHFLTVHDTQLAIYETTKLERVTQWRIGDFCARISHGTYSGDNQLVYAVMRDGIVMILGSDLSPRFEIDPSVYLSPDIGARVYPVAVAAHPQKPYQFAVGLSTGDVIVVEPHKSEAKWSALPPVFNELTRRIIRD